MKFSPGVTVHQDCNKKKKTLGNFAKPQLNVLDELFTASDSIHVGQLFKH